MINNSVPPAPVSRKLLGTGSEGQRFFVHFEPVMSEHSLDSFDQSLDKVSDKVSDKGRPKMRAKMSKLQVPHLCGSVPIRRIAALAGRPVDRRKWFRIKFECG